MTAWCSSTTSVRKVRARSSDRLRVLTFGAARTSAVAADDEIEVMRAPWQGDCLRCCRWEPDSARPQIPVQPTGPPRNFAKRPLQSSEKVRQIADPGQRW